MCHSGEVNSSLQRDFDVVVVGSANLDLVASLEHLPKPGETLIALAYAEHAGGKGLNQAVACARMGARTAFIGCVGNDDAGAMLRDILEREGIDTSGLLSVDAPTGRAFINVDANGENAIVVVSGANAEVGADHAIVLPTSHVVLAQLEIPLAAVAAIFEAAHKHGATTVLNPAPAARLHENILTLTDIIVPNETESDALGGTSVMFGAGVHTVVTTRGADGATVETPSSTHHVAPFTVNPIDTVGAGDAFIGAMCAEIARGVSVLDAAKVGVVGGALATSVRGAVPSLPTNEQVRKAMGAQQ
jgi:ribokinase